MHKKLASELTSLAHSILQMNNKDNVFLLQKKAHQIYEKLSVLAYIEEYINTTPQATETKEELLTKVKEAENVKELKNKLETPQPKTKEDPNFVATTIDKTSNSSEEQTKTTEKLDDNEPLTDEFTKDFDENIIEETNNKVVINNSGEDLINQPNEETEQPFDDFSENYIEKTSDKTIIDNSAEKIEQPFDELEELMFSDNEKFDESLFIQETKTPTLEEELKDTISVDVTADLFTKAEPKKTLNDRLQNTIQIGLNDRIAFVKHLFNGDSGDFNRVVSQLNTFDSEREAKRFINKNVKPDYDWSNKEEYEMRFLEIVERKFN